MTRVLFVCTGNYYRSRFAEIVFNHFAGMRSIPVAAFSRGLRLNPGKNKGPLSPHAVAYLCDTEISFHQTGEPTKLEREDLESADHIILLDENEHRLMIRNSFPDWEHKVEYWKFEDDYITSPLTVLPMLETRVHALLSFYRPKTDDAAISPP